MKSEIILYGEELLKIIDKNPDIPFKKLEEITSIKGEELRELLKYLRKKEYINWKMPLFVGTSERIDFIDTDKIKLAHSGMEVVIGERAYFDTSEKISQEINVHNSSGVQVAQNTGDSSSIAQTQESNQVWIINQMIEGDAELNSQQKTELKSVVKKIEEGISKGEKIEKVYEWVKRGVGVCAKYGPYLLNLIR